MHDGSELHPNHGAPEGNDYANGNKGGAPPIGNTNAMKHGIYAARSTLRARISPKEKQWLEDMSATVARRIAMNERSTVDFEVARQSIGEDIAWLFYRKSLADTDIAKRGIDLDGRQLNPSVAHSRHLGQRIFRLLRNHH
ncbi:hypothetical protein [Halalkalicoccus sp. NIPERK01]|uniref:hypothetical protein n=1 Tax=Halalkalicoccus sp. NIPERK01 TaxID=3053469 RepID=UPI00256EC62C|nr:hypothetical protein [Halalkalicoccus sp. NIPERK01]